MTDGSLELILDCFDDLTATPSAMQDIFLLILLADFILLEEFCPDTIRLSLLLREVLASSGTETLALYGETAPGILGGGSKISLLLLSAPTRLLKPLSSLLSSCLD